MSLEAGSTFAPGSFAPSEGSCASGCLSHNGKAGAESVQMGPIGSPRSEERQSGSTFDGIENPAIFDTQLSPRVVTEIPGEQSASDTRLDVETPVDSAQSVAITIDSSSEPSPIT